MQLYTRYEVRMQRFQQLNEFVIILLMIWLDVTTSLIKPGRRVCPISRASSQVVPSPQTYIRPFIVPCNGEKCGNSSRVVYKVAVRTVFYRQVVHDAVRKCCPGWTNFEPKDEQCMKPVCKSECLNGGSCRGPDYCACPQNFTGPLCELDVNECDTGNHNCQQLCNNTVGGYSCSCYDGFRPINDRECEFCPLCLREFESVMNKVDELQTRLKTVESSKEEFKDNVKDLERNYLEAMEMVGELQAAQFQAPSSTTQALPKDNSRINPRNNFELITSLSDQLGAIEEQIGFMMGQMDFDDNDQGRRRGRG